MYEGNRYEQLFKLLAIFRPRRTQLSRSSFLAEKTVSTTILKPVFHDFILCHERALVEFQVVQRDYDLLEVYLVPGERFDESHIEELGKRINFYLPEVHPKFTLCSSIANTPSGKTQVFVSHIETEDTMEGK